ncbi:MAG: LacI family transcriptional regulator, partial [Acetobacteraceae bacterium]
MRQNVTTWNHIRLHQRCQRDRGHLVGKTTILDVAAKAGVSTATVDRVLNGRPGVSAANRHRVLHAAKELGYLPFEGMVALPSRPVHLEFFIPMVQNGFMGELVASIRRFAATMPIPLVRNEIVSSAGRTYSGPN